MSNIVTIRLSKEMILEELYSLRAEVPLEYEEAKQRIEKIIQIINNSPVDDRPRFAQNQRNKR